MKKVKSIYADNAPESYVTAKRLGWSFPSATPGQPQSNGLAERMVRRVKEGGRACLVQSGLTREWWAYACAFFCFARNVNVVDGDSSYHRRHKTGNCKALKVPFGHMVGFLPVSNPNDKNFTFDKKTRTGLMVGYHE